VRFRTVERSSAWPYRKTPVHGETRGKGAGKRAANSNDHRRTHGRRKEGRKEGTKKRAREQTEERFKERPRSFSLCPVRSRYRVGEILLSQPRDGESPMREHKGPPARPPSEEKGRGKGGRSTITIDRPAKRIEVCEDARGKARQSGRNERERRSGCCMRGMHYGITT